MKKPREWASPAPNKRALPPSLCRILSLCRFWRSQFTLPRMWWWKWHLMVLLMLLFLAPGMNLKRLVIGNFLSSVGAELWKSIQMCRSLSVASVTCNMAHNSGNFLVHADKWIHTCKIWYNLHVSLNFCKNNKKVNTCSPTWDLSTSCQLSSLSWTVSLLFSAAPTGQLFLTTV